MFPFFLSIAENRSFDVIFDQNMTNIGVKEALDVSKDILLKRIHLYTSFSSIWGYF